MSRLPWRENRNYVAFAAGPYRQHFNAVADSRFPGVADHPDYTAAKYHGDVSAALRVVETTMNRLYLARLKITLNELKEKGIESPILVAPYKEESPNRLARVSATYLGKQLGLDVDTAIVENPGCPSKELSKLERLFHSPEFSGEVQKGRWYIIVDDNIQTGNKIAALRSHIVEGGGRFLFGCVLSSLSGKDVQLNASKSEITQLTSQFGENLLSWFERMSHVALDGLTKSEAAFLSQPQGRKQLLGFAAQAGLFRG